MIKAKEVFRHYQSNKQQCLSVLQEALDKGIRGEPGGVKPSEFSFRDLAAYFVQADGEPIGHESVAAWASGRLLEADAISSNAFAAVTQRIVNAAVLEGYQLVDMPLSRIVRTVQARSRDTRIPNFTLPLADKSAIEYAEGQDKPLMGMMAEYVKSLTPVKRGGRIPITREAVVFDETGMVIESARRIGEAVALEKERTLTRFVIGLVSNCVIEYRKTYSSELTADLFYASGGNWTNQQANPLSDWTDFDDAENLLLGNTLPGTNLPPMLSGRVVLVPHQLRSRVFHVLNATEVRSGSTNIVASTNPIADRSIQTVVSPLVYAEQVAAGVASATAAGTWFYGDMLQAVRYAEVWPLEVTENRDDVSLRRADIVVEFHASEHGIPMIVEPRVWTKNTPS